MQYLTLLATFVVVLSSCVDNKLNINFGSNNSPSEEPRNPEDLICPLNFLKIPAMAPYAPADFCVAEYEMKIAGDDNGDQPYDVNFVADSRPSGTPWVNVNRAQARAECRALGPKYDLITTDEWQAMARNLEQQTFNWDQGTVGSAGGISRSLGMTTGVAAGSKDDACLGTGNTCNLSTWNPYRRIHRISTGSYIWDVGGNVGEWNKGRLPVSSPHPVDHAISQTTGLYKDLIGPLNNYLSNNSEPYAGFGECRTTLDNGTIIRSGAWGTGSSISHTAGIFSVYSTAGESYSDNSIGFRCVYHPTLPATQSIFAEHHLPQTANSADANPYELGIRFQSDVDGTVTAIRFYRGVGDISGYTVNLWSDGGGLLGSGTGVEGTLPGWQEINLSTPVHITAGNIYVASYFTAAGNYPFTPNAFIHSYPGNYNLTAEAAGGVFKAGASSAYPDDIFGSPNYYVDVKFTPDP